MKNEQIIKKIAKASRCIVYDADAQNITTEDEVESIVVELLSNQDSLAAIENDAKAKTEELRYLQYHERGFALDAESFKTLVKAALFELVHYGADYGPLSCIVLDGADVYSTVRDAVRQGLVDNWGHFINDLGVAVS